MKRVLTLVVVALLAYATVASAHGPTRKKVVIERDIAAPPDKVWALIGNFHDMSWHPAVTDTLGDGGNTPGAKRTLVLGNGGKIHESLEKYDADARSLFYRIDEVDVKILPVTNYSSWLTVKANGDGSSVVWRGAFYRGYPNNDPPPELSDDAAVNAVTGIYESGLDNVKKLAEGG
ncbi:MAG: SRPBCC family protein [Gammaproteobacteria bacterium]|nr:SRPBCC family protein [Gammaproteobacteria bacterium]MCB1922956.1 SRPBCC family protein [Gammaproteobacteria bacterium]